MQSVYPIRRGFSSRLTQITSTSRIRYVCLVLFDQLRLKFAVPVSGNFNFHFTHAALHGLSRMSVAAVGCPLVFVVIFTLAKFIVQLCIKGCLDGFGSQHFHEFMNIVHVLDAVFCDLLSEFTVFFS